jgi:hypothetical protein
MWATENMGEEIGYARVVLISGVRNVKEINVSWKSEVCGNYKTSNNK